MIHGIPLFFVMLGVAILGLAVAWVSERAHQAVFLILGLIFTGEGACYVYFVSMGAGSDASVVDALLGFCVLGIPLGVLCLSLWRRHIGGAESCMCVRHYGACVALNALNFILVPLPIANVISRLGGGALAIALAARNGRG